MAPNSRVPVVGRDCPVRGLGMLTNLGHRGNRRRGVGMLTRKRLLATIAIFVVGGLIGLVAPSAYALSQTPDTTPWVVRGKVFALTETADHNTIYIGGKFSRASTQDGSMPYFPFSLTRFDETTGVGDSTFTPVVTDAT